MLKTERNERSPTWLLPDLKLNHFPCKLGLPDGKDKQEQDSYQYLVPEITISTLKQKDVVKIY